MKYIYAEDLQKRMEEMVVLLSMDHIDTNRVKCFRSMGSSTKRTLARCHTIGKLMQKAMNVGAHYTIEFLEKFEKLSVKEQDKVIIHELLHIPKTFGGGFRQHDFVCEENVDLLHQKYVNLKKKDLGHFDSNPVIEDKPEPYSTSFASGIKEWLNSRL